MSGGFQCLHANESKTATAKENVKQNYSIDLRRNVNTDFLIFIKCKFLRMLVWSRSQVVITLSEKEKKTIDTAEFISILTFR